MVSMVKMELLDQKEAQAHKDQWECKVLQDSEATMVPMEFKE